MDLRQTAPQSKIIAISGSGQSTTPDSFLRTTQALGARRALLKPFTPDVLLDTGREVLQDAD